MTGQRQLRIVVAVVAVVGAIALFVALRPPGYVGTERRVAIEWQCANGIFWRNGSGTAWWSAGNRPSGPLETRARVGADPFMSTKHADGVLRFDTEKHATFTSDAGGTLVLTRQPKDAFYEAGCAMWEGS